MAGKGDKPRPVNKKQYDANWDEIIKDSPKVGAVEVKRLKNGKVRYIYTKKEKVLNDEELHGVPDSKLEDQGSQSTSNETLSAV